MTVRYVTLKCPKCDRTTRQLVGVEVACIGQFPDRGAGNRHPVKSMRPVTGSEGDRP